MKRRIIGITLSIIILCFNGCAASNVLVPDRIAVSEYVKTNIPEEARCIAHEKYKDNDTKCSKNIYTYISAQRGFTFHVISSVDKFNLDGPTGLYVRHIYNDYKDSMYIMNESEREDCSYGVINFGDMQMSSVISRLNNYYDLKPMDRRIIDKETYDDILFKMFDEKNYVAGYNDGDRFAMYVSDICISYGGNPYIKLTSINVEDDKVYLDAQMCLYDDQTGTTPHNYLSVIFIPVDERVCKVGGEIGGVN